MKNSEPDALMAVGGGEVPGSDTQGCRLVVASYEVAAPLVSAATAETARRIMGAPALGDFMELRFVDMGPQPGPLGNRSAAARLILEELLAPGDESGRNYFAIAVADRSAAEVELVLTECINAPFLNTLPVQVHGIASVDDRRSAIEVVSGASIAIAASGAWNYSDLVDELRRHANELLVHFAAGRQGLSHGELDSFRDSYEQYVLLGHGEESAGEPGAGVPDELPAVPASPALPDILAPEPPPPTACAAAAPAEASTAEATTGEATTGEATTGEATTGEATTGEATTARRPRARRPRARRPGERPRARRPRRPHRLLHCRSDGCRGGCPARRGGAGSRSNQNPAWAHRQKRPGPPAWSTCLSPGTRSRTTRPLGSAAGRHCSGWTRRSRRFRGPLTKSGCCRAMRRAYTATCAKPGRPPRRISGIQSPTRTSPRFSTKYARCCGGTSPARRRSGEHLARRVVVIFAADPPLANSVTADVFSRLAQQASIIWILPKPAVALLSRSFTEPPHVHVLPEHDDVADEIAALLSPPDSTAVAADDGATADTLVIGAGDA